MTIYIGTKLIKALPMTRQAYNDYRGWELPADEDGTDAGYLVEYLDGGRANHPDHAGYISWSPADVFEKAYRPSNGLDFSGALTMLKTGYRVARAGWNGKGMWLALVPGDNYAVAGRTAEELDLLPWIGMKTADGKFVPWLASQTDMLAEDWQVLA